MGLKNGIRDEKKWTNWFNTRLPCAATGSSVSDVLNGSNTSAAFDLMNYETTLPLPAEVQQQQNTTEHSENDEEQFYDEGYTEFMQ